MKRNHMVKVTYPETGKIVTQLFDNEDRAARWAARMAGNGLIVEMNGRKYIPTNANIRVGVK